MFKKIIRMLKEYQRKLYNHLHETPAQNANVPLQNIKNSLGSVALMKGNPLTKTEITLNINTFFYGTVAGLIIAPAALPANIQTSIPTYLFSLTDFYGGFSKSTILNAPINPWVLSSRTFAGAPRSPITIYGYNSGNLIGDPERIIVQPLPGDLLIYFDDNAVAPATPVFCCIRVRCQNVAYGTFLNSFVSDLITLSTLRYVVPIANINQYINPLIFGYQTLFGKVTSDSIDPRMYITSKDFQQQIADIPVNLPIDKAMMLSFQLDVFCQALSIILFVEKIEPLTHK
jgi:hypothetical protein